MKGVTVVSDKTAMLKAAIKALTKGRVLVGIPSEDAQREPEPDEPSPDINNAEIGYLNEFGMPEINLPARPHLVPGVEDALPQVTITYRKAAADALDGKIEDVNKAHAKVGLQAVSKVQARITDGPFVPLSEATIANRKARGRTGEKPLIDTGQYRRSITYVVRPAKGQGR